MLPCWQDQIVPELQKGRRVLIVSHGNTLRALAMHLEGLSEGEIVELEIPTGVPLVYELDGDLRLLSCSVLQPRSSKR
jgi:2,3-bisphosphoglycerate-dependent phosphoglycerate mutase